MKSDAFLTGTVPARGLSLPVGPWLRLTALCGAAGTLVAVISGSAGLGTAHRVLAAVALPPLAAVTAAAWINHRRLLPSAVAALALFGLAAAITAPGLHLALSALAFAATLVLVAQSWSHAEDTLQHSVTKSNGRSPWAEILERAAHDDTQRKPAETIAACLQVALWHGRYDLASAAARRLLKEDVPPEMSRAQLRFARLTYGGLALADRARSVLRR